MWISKSYYFAVRFAVDSDSFSLDFCDKVDALSKIIGLRGYSDTLRYCDTLPRCFLWIKKTEDS
jgi:hypothetical protein